LSTPTSLERGKEENKRFGKVVFTGQTRNAVRGAARRQLEDLTPIRGSGAGGVGWGVCGPRGREETGLTLGL